MLFPIDFSFRFTWNLYGDDCEHLYVRCTKCYERTSSSDDDDDDDSSSESMILFEDIIFFSL